MEDIEIKPGESRPGRSAESIERVSNLQKTVELARNKIHNSAQRLRRLMGFAPSMVRDQRRAADEMRMGIAQIDQLQASFEGELNDVAFLPDAPETLPLSDAERESLSAISSELNQSRPYVPVPVEESYEDDIENNSEPGNIQINQVPESVSLPQSEVVLETPIIIPPSEPVPVNQSVPVEITELADNIGPMEAVPEPEIIEVPVILDPEPEETPVLEVVPAPIIEPAPLAAPEPLPVVEEHEAESESAPEFEIVPEAVPEFSTPMPTPVESPVQAEPPVLKSKEPTEADKARDKFKKTLEVVSTPEEIAQAREEYLKHHPRLKRIAEKAKREKVVSARAISETKKQPARESVAVKREEGPKFQAPRRIHPALEKAKFESRINTPESDSVVYMKMLFGRWLAKHAQIKALTTLEGKKRQEDLANEMADKAGREPAGFKKHYYSFRKIRAEKSAHALQTQADALELRTRVYYDQASDKARSMIADIEAKIAPLEATLEQLALGREQYARDVEQYGLIIENAIEELSNMEALLARQSLRDGQPQDSDLVAKKTNLYGYIGKMRASREQNIARLANIEERIRTIRKRSDEMRDRQRHFSSLIKTNKTPEREIVQREVSVPAPRRHDLGTMTPRKLKVVEE